MLPFIYGNSLWHMGVDAHAIGNNISKWQKAPNFLLSVQVDIVCAHTKFRGKLTFLCHVIKEQNVSDEKTFYA
jgi:hypothetical protein